MTSGLDLKTVKPYGFLVKPRLTTRGREAERRGAAQGAGQGALECPDSRLSAPHDIIMDSLGCTRHASRVFGRLCASPPPHGAWGIKGVVELGAVVGRITPLSFGI